MPVIVEHARFEITVLLELLERPVRHVLGAALVFFLGQFSSFLAKYEDDNWAIPILPGLHPMNRIPRSIQIVTVRA